MYLDPRTDPDWVQSADEALRDVGYAVVRSVLDAPRIDELRTAVRAAQVGLAAAVGAETVARAAADGYIEIRLPMLFDDAFLRVLELPEVLAAADAHLGPNAVLRYMNAAVIPPRSATRPTLRQAAFHTNFKRPLGGARCALEFGLYLDATGQGRAGLQVVAGSHHRTDTPPAEYLERAARTVAVGAGDLLLMDGMLWHRETTNDSADELVSVPFELTRSYFKPHFDHVRALGEERVAALPERTRKFLGWHTRVPASLEEFYRPPSERLYQPGQD